MPKMFNVDELNERRVTHGIFDDFYWLISPHAWTTTLTDSGTATVANGVGGILPLVMSDGTVADNDEASVALTNKPFTIADDKPMVFECRVQWTEANTDDANVLAGFVSAVGANSLVDDGAGPAVSNTICAFYKVDGSNNWRVRTSVGSYVAGTAGQTDTLLAQTAGGASYQTLRIEVLPQNSTEADVQFFIDGSPVTDYTTGRPVKHRMIYTSAAAQAAYVGGKNGGANLETLNVDYIGAYQRRIAS